MKIDRVPPPALACVRVVLTTATMCLPTKATRTTTPHKPNCCAIAILSRYSLQNSINSPAVNYYIRLLLRVMLPNNVQVPSYKRNASHTYLSKSKNRHRHQRTSILAELLNVREHSLLHHPPESAVVRAEHG